MKPSVVIYLKLSVYKSFKCYTNEEFHQIYDKNDGKCWHCGKQLTFTHYGKYGEKGAWEVDHSHSKNKGGTDYFRNLVPSCIKCNRSKGDATKHSSC